MYFYPTISAQEAKRTNEQFTNLKCFGFSSIIIFTIQILLYISSTWEKGKNRVKQSEIEIKLIMKMKRHKLCSNWQINFIGDPDKQTLNTPQTSYPL